MQKRFFLFFLSFLLLLASCKKSDPITSTTQVGTVLFHIQTNVGSGEVDSGFAQIDTSGRRLLFTKAQFLISDVQLQNSDGSYLLVQDVVILKTISNDQYMVASIAAGTYTSVRFFVGLETAANQLPPSSYPSTSPLSNKNNWFGTTSAGYIFMDMEGKIDTTAHNNGTPVAPFSFQLGTTPMLEIVSMPQQTFTIVSGQSHTINLIADCNRLFAGVDIKANRMASPTSNATIAQQIANNIPNMFRYGN